MAHWLKLASATDHELMFESRIVAHCHVGDGAAQVLCCDAGGCPFDGLVLALSGIAPPLARVTERHAKAPL